MREDHRGNDLGDAPDGLHGCGTNEAGPMEDQEEEQGEVAIEEAWAGDAGGDELIQYLLRTRSTRSKELTDALSRALAVTQALQDDIRGLLPEPVLGPGEFPRGPGWLGSDTWDLGEPVGGPYVEPVEFDWLDPVCLHCYEPLEKAWGRHPECG